ncbi:MAG TPA: ABC transporter permease [Thermoanaerobaculia bacterium]|jgi:ABC-type Na+ efflux pump permease subunit
MNDKTILVARRELVENVRTKSFWIGIFFFPILISAAIVIPILVEKNKEARRYAVIDRSGWLLAAIEQTEGASLAASRFVREDVGGDSAAALDPEALLEDLNRRVGDQELFAYFVIGEDPVEGAGEFKYVSSNLTDDGLLRWFEGLASEVVRARRFAASDVDEEVAAWVQKPLRFTPRKVVKGGAEEDVETQDKVRQWAPAVFAYVLWFAVFMISQALLTNTIEEKANRIMEVLLSSVSPLQLMAGKIAGIAATGLAMLGSWVVFFYLATKLIPRAMGVEPSFDLSVIATDPVFIGSFLVYFLLGYLLFAALLVGVGSVCNSLKEAQNMQMPVTLVLMVPLFLLMPVAQDPNGTLARVASYVPPFTPFVMMNRAAGPPTTFEYVVTTALLVLSLGAALWAAAKVFRIGVLMTGKPPRLAEILKWLRAPVGQVPERRE